VGALAASSSVTRYRRAPSRITDSPRQRGCEEILSTPGSNELGPDDLHPARDDVEGALSAAGLMRARSARCSGNALRAPRFDYDGTACGNGEGQREE